MAFRMPPKDPDEVLDYEMNWTKTLAGDTIASSSVILEEGDCVVDSQEFSGAVQTVWLSGGSHNTDCILTMRIVTAFGRTFDEVIKVKIVAKEL
jgi:hypothetical protein